MYIYTHISLYIYIYIYIKAPTKHVFHGIDNHFPRLRSWHFDGIDTCSTPTKHIFHISNSWHWQHILPFELRCARHDIRPQRWNNVTKVRPTYMLRCVPNLLRPARYATIYCCRHELKTLTVRQKHMYNWMEKHVFSLALISSQNRSEMLYLSLSIYLSLSLYIYIYIHVCVYIYI